MIHTDFLWRTQIRLKAVVNSSMRAKLTERDRCVMWAGLTHSPGIASRTGCGKTKGVWPIRAVNTSHFSVMITERNDKNVPHGAHGRSKWQTDIHCERCIGKYWKGMKLKLPLK